MEGFLPSGPPSSSTDRAPKDPLHGVKLAEIVSKLVARYGWSELGKRINIRCFNSDPSVQSSLKFLRRTPWARKKVEGLYVATFVNPKKRRRSGNP